VQPIFLADPPMWTVDGDDLVAKCARLIDRARSHGTPVVFIQHADEHDMPGGVAEEDKAIHRDLAPQEGEPVVRKIYGSGFMQTDLTEILAARGIRHLLICGLSAYGCVNETVLFGKLLGFDITVVKDAVAAPNLDTWPAGEGIPTFLSEWRRAGMSLQAAEDVSFPTPRSTQSADS
jgi:nicotinamidase-related amidase